jgi:hypothetical protein
VSYLARPYRWSRLADELASASASASAAAAAPASGGRDPRSASWERLYGRALPGATAAEQAAVVSGWLRADLADPAVRRTVALGARRPGALERAVGSVAGAEDWPERVSSALAEAFVAGDWPLRFLVGVDG